jgi:prolyl-tRNA editing enzyme YbaK/EbsC (Cys-tRNA(Pro) deacylase)
VDHPALGTLDWQPASEHLELLAPPVAAAVQALDLECFVAPIDPALADTAAFCAAYDVPLAASANCVVVAGRRGETTTTAACLVLALDRADVNKVVRRRLDVRKISFAGLDDAVRQTQMEHGGITPVGLPDDWPVLVDEAVAGTPWVVIGSGVRGSKVALRGAVLATLPAAETLALAVSAAG